MTWEILLLYLIFGAIGWVNELNYYLDLARVCMAEGLNIKFLIIGCGAQEKKLLKRSRNLRLNNLIFIHHLNKYELRKYLSVTDASFISFANYQILENNSPNKFFDSLASGKLVISNVKGWIKELIEDHACGLYINPEIPEDFVSMISPIIKDHELLNKYKKNARELAENKFDRKILTANLLNFIEN